MNISFILFLLKSNLELKFMNCKYFESLSFQANYLRNKFTFCGGFQKFLHSDIYYDL